MATKTYHGRCPRCCPDGGACFEQTYDYDTKSLAKKCTCCGQVLPLRRIKATGKPTKRQQRVIDKVVGLFGGTPEVKMIGKKVFLSLVNRARNWLLGDSLFGTIGPRGAFEIKLQRIGGDAVLTDDIGLEVYLQSYAKKV